MIRRLLARLDRWVFGVPTPVRLTPSPRVFGPVDMQHLRDGGPLTPNEFTAWLRIVHGLREWEKETR